MFTFGVKSSSHVWREVRSAFKHLVWACEKGFLQWGTLGSKTSVRVIWETVSSDSNAEVSACPMNPPAPVMMMFSPGLL